MKQMPYGISDFKDLIMEGYEYIDKTDYLEKLESVGKTLLCLRPGRFGKSLFTSMMFYYYDVASLDDFESLFKDTYIYQHPTKRKNNYYCINLDFSGISTDVHTAEALSQKFKDRAVQNLQDFIDYYHFDYKIDTSKSADTILGDVLTYVKGLKLDQKIYVIVDEYDNFTNAILEGDAKDFLSVVGNAGVIKSFYANIKAFVKTGLIDRVFITGICPITLDSMTTGFNIAKNISDHPRFNAMIGFTHEEIKKVLDKFSLPNNEELFHIMLNNYDGYTFSSETDEMIFNSTLAMYYFDQLEDIGKPPKDLLDSNIAFNYGKLNNLLKLQNNEFYHDVLENTLLNKTVIGTLKRQFNLSENFTRDDIISLLYYFGYLTIGKNDLGDTVFSIPNRIMETILAITF